MMHPTSTIHSRKMPCLLALPARWVQPCDGCCGLMVYSCQHLYAS